MLIWLKGNYKRVLQFVAWTLLFWFGNNGLGTISNVDQRVAALQSQVASLQSANAALAVALDLTRQQVEALRIENAALREQVRFLTECLTNPMPFLPGQKLCPRPKEPGG